jgi:DNA-binding SARP family transcriptional activator
MQLLTIKLLGGFDIIYDDRSLADIISERQRSLLAHLVLYPHNIHQRQQLALLLWPDSIESQARTNLRRAIHTLRQIFPEIEQFIEMEAQTLQWKVGVRSVVDVTEFEQAIATSAAAERAGQPISLFAALEKAAGLYQGKLLPSCRDPWIKPEQKRLQQQCIQVYAQFIQLLLERENYREVIHYSQKLLRLDPLHESAYLHLMQSYMQSGDRSNALQSYHRCCTIFDELGRQPSAGTQILYESLL